MAATFIDNQFTTGTSNGTTVPVTMPPDVSTGDALTAILRFGDVDTFYDFYTSGAGSFAPPAGWTIVATAFVAGIFLTAYAKVADGSESGTTVNFSYGVGNGVAGTRHKYVAVVHQMSGVDSFNVPDSVSGVEGVWAQAGFSGSATAVITDFPGDALVLAAMSRATTTWTNATDREAETLDVSSEDGLGNNIKLDVSDVLDTSGASDRVLAFSGFCQGVAVGWNFTAPVLASHWEIRRVAQAGTSDEVDAVALSDDTPLPIDTTGDPGVGLEASRDDHVHAHEAAHIQHDTTWAAKGDLIAGTANDTAAVLPVGTNDWVLTADSGETTGMKWAAGGGGGGGIQYETDPQVGDWLYVETAEVETTGGPGLGTPLQSVHVKATDYDVTTDEGEYTGGGTILLEATDAEGVHSSSVTARANAVTADAVRAAVLQQSDVADSFKYAAVQAFRGGLYQYAFVGLTDLGLPNSEVAGMMFDTDGDYAFLLEDNTKSLVVYAWNGVDNYVPIMRLDGSGNLQIAGTLTENWDGTP